MAPPAGPQQPAAHDARAAPELGCCRKGAASAAVGKAPPCSGSLPGVGNGDRFELTGGRPTRTARKPRR